ncbi:unnamed protein product [Rhizophagus irregularis]|nr:unnamed protein product [Rhizophagus irregularis]
MEILNKTSKEKPRNLWKDVNWKKYQTHVTVSSINSATKSEEIDDNDVSSISTNLISECFDVQLSESDLDGINQEEEI